MAASGLYTKASDLTALEDTLNKRWAVHLDSGTGAGKADLRFTDTRTLSASATEDLDLSGSLLDSFGAALAFVKVKGLFIKAADGNTNNVVIGAAAANPWTALLGATGTIVVRPGMTVGAMCGAADVTCLAVVPGTGDLLKAANSAGGTSVTYDIVIIGSSV
ncbi:hypothetical protein [Streptomyces lunaelactis]|uniref:hypothetical protein n=1 Tax=Streptomyces lunaelactis TaxID=1535768 RepID=UPI0015850514|nr:hypothetical protein [Streptomyces lunaelactis]NUK22067.1 hypothetical protein [Streptomyces lunaelactis]